MDIKTYNPARRKDVLNTREKLRLKLVQRGVLRGQELHCFWMIMQVLFPEQRLLEGVRQQHQRRRSGHRLA